MRSYTEEELAHHLSKIDDRLVGEGAPLYLRPAECFKELYGSVHDGDGRKQLFDPITIWFVAKYGFEKMEWDRVIGRIPVILRSELYLVQVPFVQEETVVKLTDRFEGLAQAVKDSLTLEEFKNLSHEIVGATHCIQTLYTLTADDLFLNTSQRQLVRRALFDLENATHSLKRTGDVQGAIFNSHAASEKFVKISLSRAGSTKRPKALGHDIPKAFKELVRLKPGYGWLTKSANELQRLSPDMEIRYSAMNRTLEDGFTAVQASIFLCGSLAQMWMFDHDRKSRSPNFKAGKFYKDGFSVDHYCMSVDSKNATMMCFKSSKHTGRQTYKISIPVDSSSLYLEVFDATEENKLRMLLTAHLRSPGKPVAPENFLITAIDGPRGNYTFGMIKRKMQKAEPD